MKKTIIVSLVCINVGLLAALMLGTTLQPAQAQPVLGADYMLVTARVRSDLAAVYILDLGKLSLSALVFDKNTRTMSPIAPRPHSLRQDFRIAGGN